jgi:hypothetical protein
MRVPKSATRKHTYGGKRKRKLLKGKGLQNLGLRSHAIQNVLHGMQFVFNGCD